MDAITLLLIIALAAMLGVLAGVSIITLIASEAAGRAIDHFTQDPPPEAPRASRPLSADELGIEEPLLARVRQLAGVPAGPGQPPARPPCAFCASTRAALRALFSRRRTPPA